MIVNAVTGEYVAVQRMTKFYFCEICGKRVTDKELDQGQARDKKLKGVYCQTCAVGVQTIEFEPINLDPAPPPQPPPSPPPPSKAISAAKARQLSAAPGSPPKPSSRASRMQIRPLERAATETPSRSSKPSRSMPVIWISAGSGVLILAVAMMLALKSEPSKRPVAPTGEATASPVQAPAPPPSPTPPVVARAAPDPVPITPVISTTSSVAAVYITTDQKTQGNWKDSYGCDGFSIVDDATSYPAYASVAVRDCAEWSGDGSTDNPRALQKSTQSGNRVAAWWYNNLSIDINLTDGQAHRVALYCLDWKGDAKAQAFEVHDAGTGALLDGPRKIEHFHNGTYLVWDIKGHVIIKLNSQCSEVATVSAIFFGASGPERSKPKN
jgi:hypothetical protein